jgi:hypothetical protein
MAPAVPELGRVGLPLHPAPPHQREHPLIGWICANVWRASNEGRAAAEDEMIPQQMAGATSWKETSLLAKRGEQATDVAELLRRIIAAKVPPRKSRGDRLQPRSPIWTMARKQRTL